MNAPTPPPSRKNLRTQHPRAVISMKVGVYATHDSPETWLEFDPEDIVEMEKVRDEGFNHLFLTIQRASAQAPIWDDYVEFFDGSFAMCASDDVLNAIIRLRGIKLQRLNHMATAAQQQSGPSPQGVSSPQNNVN